MPFLIAAVGLLTLITVSVALYHTMLALVALCLPGKPARSESDGVHSFAIVIPAHDEEQAIVGTLASCGGLDYPPARHEVIVIADNCTDRTAEVAGARGATCLERNDPGRRGKGYALTWAFERLLPREYDAIVVLDADSTIDPQALRVFDRYLARDDRVLQANDVASNPDDSATSYAAALANYLENDLFYGPKSRLGLAVFLRGTGMVLHRSILERHPWRASSFAEDTEYSLELIRDRIPIRFVAEVRVSSPFPADGRQLSAQRERWVGGTLAFSRTRMWRLILEGLLRRDLVLMDAGWTLFNLVRSLLVVWVAVAMAAATALAWASPGAVTIAMAVACAASAGLLAAYVILGIFRFGLSGDRLRFLGRLPVNAARMVVIAGRGLWYDGPKRWGHAPRPAAEPMSSWAPGPRTGGW